MRAQRANGGVSMAVRLSYVLISSLTWRVIAVNSFALCKIPVGPV